MFIVFIIYNSEHIKAMKYFYGQFRYGTESGKEGSGCSLCCIKHFIFVITTLNSNLRMTVNVCTLKLLIDDLWSNNIRIFKCYCYIKQKHDVTVFHDNE